MKTNKASGWKLTTEQAADIDASRVMLDKDNFRIAMENAQAMIDLFDCWRSHTSTMSKTT